MVKIRQLFRLVKDGSVSCFCEKKMAFSYNLRDRSEAQTSSEGGINPPPIKKIKVKPFTKQQARKGGKPSIAKLRSLLVSDDSDQDDSDQDDSDQGDSDDQVSSLRASTSNQPVKKSQMITDRHKMTDE